jgi:Protein of unknown function (DUF2946)
MAAVLMRSVHIRSRPDTARNLLALLVALAFALQSFFTQTHIHHWPQNLDGPAIVKVTAGDPMGGSAPSDGTPLDCPFCQAIAHTGLFFLPTAPLLHVPVASVQSVALRITRPFIKNAAVLSRRSRAPPAAP